MPRMSLPVCIVQLNVGGTTTRTDEIAQDRSVAFEVNRDTLETMLDGLNKIRDQLAAVAGASQ